MFLDELRRRKVFRTGTAYLAGAFVILQVADLTFDPLGFSPRAYQILILIAAIGFPIALVLSWFFDVRGTSEARPSTRVMTLTAAAILIFATAGFAYFAVSRFRKADNDMSATIAIMPFRVIGGPQLQYLGEGIVEMLGRNIDGAANLRAIPAEMTIQSAKKKLPVVARFVVEGNVAQAGSNVRLTATIRDTRRNKRATREVSGSADSLFTIIDRLSAQVLAATRYGADANLSESAATTTSSLAALREFLEGEQHYRKTQYDSAAAHYAQAAQLDSTFALAHYRQSLALVNNGNMGSAREPLERALRFRDRLAERDREQVEAYEAFFNGRYEEAREKAHALTVKYPDDLEASFNYSQIVTLDNPAHGKPFRSEKENLERIASLDPEFFCPI